MNEPTHFSVGSDTLIDLVCTNCRIRDISVTNITGSLGHAMINVTLTLRKSKIPPRSVTYRPIKNIDINKFNEDLLTHDWASVSCMSTVDDMVDRFNTLIMSLFDRHAPIITRKFKRHQSLPWITDTIKCMIDLRNKAHNKYRKSKLERDKKYYKDLKNTVSVSIAAEKKAYYNHYINSNTSNSKVFWKNLRDRILIDPCKSDYLPDSFNDPNSINKYFLKVPGPEKVPISQLTYFEFHRFNTTTPSFRLEPISSNDVAKYILSIQTNAIGTDGISRDIVLLTLPHTLSIITDIINKSIVTGVVPHQWKKALIIPLPKVDHPKEFKDLRPISILPFLSKILEKAIYIQLLKYIEVNKILPLFQSGFRKGRGTVTTLLDVTDNILAAQDDGQGSILTLLDFSRAFDSLNISLLLSKLSYYGFDHHSINWFKSYLGERFQAVKLLKDDGIFPQVGEAWSSSRIYTGPTSIYYIQCRPP